MPESACREQSETIELRFEDLPFSKIPGQSKLFLEYLKDSSALKEFYPSAVREISDLAARKDEVLDNYSVDRDVICDILVEQNELFGSGERTFANINDLRQTGTVTVLTGQQAGLFTGPLYTIYKALTAIRFAEKLSRDGVKTVPIFWMATEDHDFEEVANAFALDVECRLLETSISVAEHDKGKPVGEIHFDERIDTAIDEWLTLFPDTEFLNELRSDVKESYSIGASFGRSFGTLLAKLFSKYGLIVFDPLDHRVKQLVSPIYQKAIVCTPEILEALRQRSKVLVDRGYHAQVLIEDDYFPLFWHDDAGKRVSLKGVGDGQYRVSGSRDTMTIDALVRVANSEPSRLSPGVMLRPAVQDHLFPTICYVGGGAEIAYFAQNSEVYRLLERPVTPIFHRQSFTVVEPRHSRTLEKYGLKFEDVFAGFEKLLPEIVERVIDPETPRVFADVEEKINTELNRLDQKLSQIDSTLANNLATRRRKVVYHIAALRTKFERVRIEKDETANRRLHAMFDALYPHGGLQERTLNFATFADRYGMQFVDWVYDSIDAENKDHRVLYL
ncbi:MAG: bacillithiol biosynthesis cysteine-adding enzyme BshC [Pyrinomonadaceae bacterium]